MRLKLGRMNRKITIEQWTDASPAQDAAGEPQGTWTTYATAWAEVMWVGGRERFIDYGRQAEVTAVFLVRSEGLGDITAAMRIDLEGTKYDIEYINEIGMREGYEIRARVRGGV